MNENDRDSRAGALQITLTLRLIDAQMHVCHQDAGRIGETVL